MQQTRQSFTHDEMVVDASMLRQIFIAIINNNHTIFPRGDRLLFFLHFYRADGLKRESLDCDSRTIAHILIIKYDNSCFYIFREEKKRLEGCVRARNAASAAFTQNGCRIGRLRAASSRSTVSSAPYSRWPSFTLSLA